MVTQPHLVSSAPLHQNREGGLEGARAGKAQEGYPREGEGRRASWGSSETREEEMGSRDPWREAPTGLVSDKRGNVWRTIQGRRSKNEAGSLAVSLGFVGEYEV